ncbi:hypothetical protein H257_13518 [Aphanomyces astaci]|uniref:Uncharacterized protein n=1 Tax=Aphanomyces astaci TaxID=112090 RepID=W4FUF5_APHAT|nr:hypothetical protein H257_13518 [Aphanomyces astaci]ETV71120.1 hypothetical protein H257_13518 [Aphanomyces astaci]|eukprot:XP_009839366.1 hypothetical protein H257_13518 [Aphanomyces astaci]
MGRVHDLAQEVHPPQHFDLAWKVNRPFLVVLGVLHEHFPRRMCVGIFNGNHKADVAQLHGFVGLLAPQPVLGLVYNNAFPPQPGCREEKPRDFFHVQPVPARDFIVVVAFRARLNPFARLSPLPD